jgi:hypothetical protein
MLPERLRESWAGPVQQVGREQSILVLDGPAMLAPVRHTEADERCAFVVIASRCAANEESTVRVDDPEIVTRLLVGALRRGAMLVATSRARSPSMTPFPSMRALLWGYAATRPCKAVQ